MADGSHIQWLADGKRLHLQHGPIDLIVEADGRAGDVRRAYENVTASFPSVLPDLVDELVFLRSPVRANSIEPSGAIAKRMLSAAARHVSHGHVTPMISVAGSVADYVLQIMLTGQQLDRAYVNNGGDIALHLDGDRCFEIGVCENPDTALINSCVRIEARYGIGGIATSGWRGRSQSLGIADAVTVLADNAANADVAATLIANAVDLPNSHKVTRLPANELNPDSDLGNMPVTTDVESLGALDKAGALQAGVDAAEQMLENKHIVAAFISLQGESRVVGRHAIELSNTGYFPRQQSTATGALHA